MGECLMYGLDLESRCLCSVHDEDSVKFLIGTHNIKLENQICSLTVEGEFSRISSQSFPHPVGEVRALAASPDKPDTIVCCSADYKASVPTFGVHMYKMDGEKRVLEPISSTNLNGCAKGFTWEPQTNMGCVLLEKSVAMFDMRDGITLISDRVFDSTLHSQAWSPHNNGTTFGVTMDKDLICLDSRTMTSSLRIRDAHSHRTLGLDFNPNLQHVVASCGDDGAIRLWDWRKAASPLLSIQPHAHWVWQVKFHPVHDQLLLSAGSDACVALSCAQSVSSEVVNYDGTDEDIDEGDSNERLEDGPLERIEEHEESVHSCAWSTGDPWTFASLSYDGRVVVSKVKRKHKYALMQL